jgi:transcription elongation factor GreA
MHMSEKKMGEGPYLTAGGAERLQAELENLQTVKRQDLAQRLRAAIQQGDLSENAEYHAAKEEQAFLEGRIQELEHLLRNAIIIEEVSGIREAVDLGASITVQVDDDDPETYMLVGAKEADPRNGRISNESPIGSALLGKKAGEQVEVETPGGMIRIKILKIE